MKFRLRRKSDLIKLTPFQKEVYRVVCSIPLGQTRTYKWVAKKVGRPKSSRGVGGALKRNPYPLIIPCHRVISCDGSFGGYIWGEVYKKKLIMLEKKIVEIERLKR